MATKGFGVSELNVDGDGITAIESTGSLLIESNNGILFDRDWETLVSVPLLVSL